MPLHHRSAVRPPIDADIYATRAADVSVPKYKLGGHELRPDFAHAPVRDELSLDGYARQNLATFCQTWLDSEVDELMDLSIEKTMIDRDEYPATAALESRCVHILADLWHSPKAADTIGCSTPGSSEACMPGGLALKSKWRQRMADEGGIVPLPGKGFGTVHPSARPSLASLNEYDDTTIGRVIRRLPRAYFAEFRATRPASAAAEQTS